MASGRLFRSALLLLAIAISPFIYTFTQLLFFDNGSIEIIIQPGDNNASNKNIRRRLSEYYAGSSPGKDHEHDLEHVLHLATRPAEDTFTDGDGSSFRVLVIVTTLAEYDKGTRGTEKGADRLKDL